jgi:hypothetical protein
MNDDHTYIARLSNFRDRSGVTIIDRRTSLQVHQIIDDRRYSQSSLKWHGNHIMTSNWYAGKCIIQLYDIRKGASSTTSSTLSPSMIWSNELQIQDAIVDFSNDFQIALLQFRALNGIVNSVVDITSNVATPLYTLPIINGYLDNRMTYDRLLCLTQEVHLLDFSWFAGHCHATSCYVMTNCYIYASM